MTFSATEAALEGFRIGRHKPVVMLIWALASLVISLGSSIAMISLFGNTLNDMAAMNGATGGDPAAAMAMMGQVGRLYLFLIPVGLVIFSIFTAAVYRAVLRPQDSAFAYLRLGADELRLAVVLLVLFVVMCVASFIVVIALSIVGVGVGMALMSSGNGAGMAAGFVIIVVVYIGMFVGSLALWTKLSLGPPMTFAEKRIRIFQSWGATKGYFWPLFGSYLLAGVLGVVVSLLGGAISFGVMSALGGAGDASGGMMGMFRAMEADFSSLSTFLTPAVMANMVVSALFSALTYAIFLAPPAVAYRDIVGARSPALAEAFN